MADPRDLVLTSSTGKIFYANGCGGYSRFDETTLDEALARFDRFAAWVAEGNGSEEADASPEMRELLIRAYGLAEKVAAGEIATELGEHPVPVLGGAA